eukprot:Cvel_14080.t1-p1 / transcript=Cvel_14080.t1 / gene=Cvel_14080 / organism=Chromera_velia_CCMP2878 / gene_product=hypothetical protein / transcript_product=hypothetical protein / location=Cvel_scaffold988:57974-59013(+) / protein_length=161 / sequence_SO=supercontig / SO=protein_coding / is_pseudo=false
MKLSLLGSLFLLGALAQAEPEAQAEAAPSLPVEAEEAAPAPVVEETEVEAEAPVDLAENAAEDLEIFKAAPPDVEPTMVDGEIWLPSVSWTSASDKETASDDAVEVGDSVFLPVTSWTSVADPSKSLSDEEFIDMVAKAERAAWRETVKEEAEKIKAEEAA